MSSNRPGNNSSPTGGQVKLVVGLGNPGVRYSCSRHNIGFLVLDTLSRREEIGVNRSKFDSLIGRGFISGTPVVLAKPQTFMNLSGVAVGKLAGYFGINTEDIIVIHDDLDFSIGDVRIKLGGGAGGHKGVQSVMDHLGDSEFVRIRLGIGRPVAGRTAESYVLERFPETEMQVVPDAVEKSCDAVVAVISSGVQAAMNKLNVRVIKELNVEV